MATTIGDIYDFIDSFAPFCCAIPEDNCGLLAGSRTASVHRVLLSLDISAAVVREAAQTQAELIVSHHPVIFHPLRAIEPGSSVEALAKNGVGAICAHTNLDVAEGGVCDLLAARIGLQAVEPINIYREHCGRPVGLARIGKLPAPEAPEAFAARVKALLGCGVLRAYCGTRAVSRVGLCSGKGNGAIPEAFARGADAYLCGDIPRDAFVYAQDHDLTLLDAGHFETETIILPALQEKLAARFPAVEFAVAQQNSALYRAI